jgi:hypothetical protein
MSLWTPAYCGARGFPLILQHCQYYIYSQGSAGSVRRYNLWTGIRVPVGSRMRTLQFPGVHCVRTDTRCGDIGANTMANHFLVITERYGDIGATAWPTILW